MSAAAAGAVRLLADALSDTREFRELKNAKTKISRNKAYADMLASFQSSQERLQSPDLPQDQAARLYAEAQRQYTQLLNIPEFKEYFTASGNFEAVIGDVIQNLYMAINARL